MSSILWKRTKLANDGYNERSSENPEPSIVSPFFLFFLFFLGTHFLFGNNADVLFIIISHQSVCPFGLGMAKVFNDYLSVNGNGYFVWAYLILYLQAANVSNAFGPR